MRGVREKILISNIEILNKSKYQNQNSWILIVETWLLFVVIPLFWSVRKQADFPHPGRRRWFYRHSSPRERNPRIVTRRRKGKASKMPRNTYLLEPCPRWWIHPPPCVRRCSVLSGWLLSLWSDTILTFFTSVYDSVELILPESKKGSIIAWVEAEILRRSAPRNGEESELNNWT